MKLKKADHFLHVSVLKTEKLPVSIYVACFQSTMALFGGMDKWNSLIIF